VVAAEAEWPSCRNQIRRVHAAGKVGGCVGNIELISELHADLARAGTPERSINARRSEISEDALPAFGVSSGADGTSFVPCIGLQASGSRSLAASLGIAAIFFATPIGQRVG